MKRGGSGNTEYDGGNIPRFVNMKSDPDVIAKIDHEYIVIRSTIPVGYCDSKNVFFMPEFLTEKNWKDDFINNKHWIFGVYETCFANKKNIFIYIINIKHKYFLCILIIFDSLNAQKKTFFLLKIFNII